MKDDMMPPQEILDAWAKDCHDGCGVTCGDRPCASCMAGGVCDRSPCNCDDPIDYYDIGDDE